MIFFTQVWIYALKSRRPCRTRYLEILFANNSFIKCSFVPKIIPELLFYLVHKPMSSLSSLAKESIFLNFITSIYHVLAKHQMNVICLIVFWHQNFQVKKKKSWYYIKDGKLNEYWQKITNWSSKEVNPYMHARWTSSPTRFNNEKKNYLTIIKLTGVQFCQSLVLVLSYSIFPHCC